MRTILHSDMNNCYASIELLHRPELRGMPLAVGGDPEARHGIVLAKDQIAKKAGVKTGMALWEARQVCPDIVFVPPRMDLYLRFSKLAHNIYADYTDQQEAFGVDESWLDVTGSNVFGGDGFLIAEDIRRRFKNELGVTVSVGVSWNKIFAKFGSDYKKPDAVTVIDRDNYKRIVWESPVDDLLYVGRATGRKLRKVGIRTIGDLALTPASYLNDLLGKMGTVLSFFARGEDQTPVMGDHIDAPIKSIGNSTTTPRDLVCGEDVKIIIFLLSESVSARLREHGFKCNMVQISVRDNELMRYEKQMKIPLPTDITDEIGAYAMELFNGSYNWRRPIRSIGVRAGDLVSSCTPYQPDIFTDQVQRDKRHRIDLAVDDLRRRFGYDSIKRGIMLLDKDLSGLNAKEDHTVHPRGYFEKGNYAG